MFPTRGLIFRKAVVYTVLVEESDETLSSTYQTAYTDACKTHHTIIVYTTVFLKMNPPRVRNM
jgi:hypothetical protein